jgi:heterodisulfide reductase subunit C
MDSNKFGFSIHTDRQINLDVADRKLYKRIALVEPSIQRCIFCGGCASTCTAAKYTEMSFRLISLHLRRGQLDEVRRLVSACLLCGKCTMVCPRDVNIRHLMIILKKELSTNEF